MNAHLAQWAGAQNVRGDLLLDFVEQNQLHIMNMVEMCEGSHTRGQAVLDYVLCSDRAREYIRSMRIDETRIRSKELSDHNMINLEIALPGVSAPVKGKKFVVKTNKSNIAELTRQALGDRQERGEKVENRDLVELIKEHSRISSEKVKINQKYPEWSVEIRRLDTIRKGISRELRRARKCKEADLEEISQRYRKAVSDVNERIARETADKDKKMYNHITRCPRNQRAKRFWS
ncbi:uncharacterized protein LOC108864157 [Galendromus occidentalis]|uniref:Uncharacterized protein LOC108864157 n=1 Tax=Galendromus occidentalis TaxID=34638 RepID=A0AAJ7L5U5_9ACAR|nr:uncharacterized protein LOC108864157 [Galendromus occidentalis]